jgi:hypothetical protein
VEKHHHTKSILQFVKQHRKIISINKDHSARALGLLELLSGHRPVADKQQDKVIKWQLPVEADPSGEYFVMFPDDLMEAADLKEGDTIEWVDQEDGSYLLKK